MKIKKIILIVLFLFVIVSCKHNSESLVSRVIVKSKNGSDIEFNVYPVYIFTVYLIIYN